jgi:para-nitrobenzyl esterase
MNTKNRRLFNALWLIAATLVSSASAQEASKSKPDQPSAVVKVDSGQLQGVEADGVISFKGIPFAAPPVGELRWRPPQPTPKWTGVRQAAEFGRSCMQGRGFGRLQAPQLPADPEAVRGLPVFERLASG